MTEGEHQENVSQQPERKNVPENSWYLVEVPSSHKVTTTRKDRSETHPIYVYARDTVNALDKAKRMRGWQRHHGQIFPSIRELTPEEERELKVKMEEAGIRLRWAKRYGFYGDRED